MAVRRRQLIAGLVVGLCFLAAVPGAWPAARTDQRLLQLERQRLHEAQQQGMSLDTIERQLRRLADDAAKEPSLMDWIASLAGALGLIAAAAAVWYAGRSLRVSQAALAPARESATAAGRQAQVALAQLEASTRPLLIEVRPYAPPTSDLGGRPDPETGRPIYKLRYPADDDVIVWDARRTHVDWRPGSRIRASVILRNVGPGLALLHEDVGVEVNGLPAELVETHVRYPRLPPTATTRINVVVNADAPSAKGELAIAVSYRSLSGAVNETATLRIATRESLAWTADSDGFAWDVVDIVYTADPGAG